MFLNDNYLVLMVLYNHKQEINNHVFTAITQAEIAEELDYSLMKINGIISKLKKAGYVNSYKNSRGRYQLTDKAYSLIDNVNNIRGKSRGR